MQRLSTLLKIYPAAVLGAFFFTGAVAAQEPSPGALGIPGSSADGINVVVTASRGAEQDPLNIPQSIDEVNRQDLDNSVYVDVQEAIKKIPGVGLAPAEGNPNYWEQGFTIRGLGSQRVLTLTDGIRQAGQGIGYGGGNISLYDTFGIEKIEVLKGPASVLYGTDSFGGVINIITRNPLERSEWGANAAARYEFDGGRDMNRYGAYMDFGSESFGTILGTSYTTAGMPNLPDHEDPMSGQFDNLSFWGKSDFRFSSDTRLRLIANSTRATDINVLTTSTTLPIATFPPPGATKPVNAPLVFGIPVYQRVMTGAEISSENIAEGWESFKTGFYWQQIARTLTRETGYYPQFGPGFTGPPAFFNPRATVNLASIRTDDKTNTYEWQTQSRHQLCDHALTWGLDTGLDMTRQPETTTDQIIGVAGIGQVDGPVSSRERVRADASQVRNGLYIQDNWNLQTWELVPGVRVDQFSVDDDKEQHDDDLWGVSGSLGTVFRPTDERSYFLNLASGFRAPDLGERFQDGIVNIGAPSRIIGNPDLDPERAYSVETGTKYRGEHLEYETAAFFNRIQDYIGLEPLGVVQGFATERYANLGLVSLYGLEAAARYDFAGGFSVYANGSRTWTNATEKVDVPGWIFNYGVEYTLDVRSEYLKQIRTGVNLRSVSSWVDNTASAGRAFFPALDDKDFTIVNYELNIALARTALGSAAIVSGVNNLFNTTYQEPFFNMIQPGRYVYAGLQLQY